MPGPLAVFGAAISAINLAASAIKETKEIGEQFGSIQDEVTVTISGGPGTNRAALYHLAASIGFGLVQRLGPNSVDIPAPGMVSISYDAADNHVTFYLRYNTSLAVALLTSQLPSRPGPDALYDQMPVLSGPKEEVVGGKWNFEGAGVGGPLVVIPGLPVPDLKNYAGRTQLTKEHVSRVPDPELAPGGGELGPTVNPRPQVDNRSRGTWANLVFTALSLPGTDYEMLFPTPPNTLDRFRGK